MSQDRQKTLAAVALARSLWTEISACLEARKQGLYEEIRAYPAPITACDQQFNYLLEQQARLFDELGRTREALKEIRPEQNPLGELAAFLDSSTSIDNPTRQRFRSRIDQGS